jgi:hypothetical protein
MNYKSIPFTQEHYSTYTAWASERGFPFHAFDNLPRIGFIIEHHDKPICMAFLTESQGVLASVGTFMSNPESTSEEREVSIYMLLDKCEEKAKELGFTVLTCATNIPTLKSKFESFGFSKTDENVTHYRRDLCRSAAF